MALVVRRSILKASTTVVSCIVSICVYTQVAFAQHPAGHVAGAGVPVANPPIWHAPIYQAPIYHPPVYQTPIYHPPVYQTPVYHPPIYQAPIYRPPILPFPTYRAPISALRISPVPSPGMRGTSLFRPPWRPTRPRPPLLAVYLPVIFGEPFWGFDSCWWAVCDLSPWTFGYSIVSPYAYGPANYGSPVVQETPVYVYGLERPDLPQLYLKDGTILNVTDYWLVGEQLHFTMIEEDGAKPVEHAIPFGELDLQKTVDVNTRSGFRFVLRNEPVEQYMRDHPDAPPLVTLPPQ